MNYVSPMRKHVSADAAWGPMARASNADGSSALRCFMVIPFPLGSILTASPSSRHDMRQNLLEKENATPAK